MSSIEERVALLESQTPRLVEQVGMLRALVTPLGPATCAVLSAVDRVNRPTPMELVLMQVA